MKWKGFYKESVDYINPKGIGWIAFFAKLPLAYIRYTTLQRSNQ